MHTYENQGENSSKVTLADNTLAITSRGAFFDLFNAEEFEFLMSFLPTSL